MISNIPGVSSPFKYGSDSHVLSSLGQPALQSAENKNPKLKLLSESGRTNMLGKSIIDESLAYRDSLAAQRAGRKSTANELKQLRYNFKDIGSQIRRSKTSANAKQVASAARREISRLKRMKSSEKYDEDELNAAINHAQSMERVAKRKAKHLLEEELVKITDKYCTEEEFEERNDGVAAPSENCQTPLPKEPSGEYAEEYYEECPEACETISTDTFALACELSEELSGTIEDMSALLEELPEELSELQSELSEELSEIFEEAAPVTGKELNTEEYKALKQKHRAKEEKALIKADTDYLKAIFKHYQDMKDGYKDAAANASPPSQTVGAATAGFNPLPVCINISI